MAISLMRRFVVDSLQLHFYRRLEVSVPLSELIYALTQFADDGYYRNLSWGISPSLFPIQHKLPTGLVDAWTYNPSCERQKCYAMQAPPHAARWESINHCPIRNYHQYPRNVFVYKRRWTIHWLSEKHTLNKVAHRIVDGTYRIFQLRRVIETRIVAEQLDDFITRGIIVIAGTNRISSSVL